MNTNMEDVGVLMDYELDLAFGADENNFECRIQAASHCCDAGYYLYFEGTEYGGIIDNIESDTATGEVVYSGRTWHGILDSKVIEPDSGDAYYIISGEANAVLASLIQRLHLSSLFKASSVDSGINIKNYRMNRYITGYVGIAKMLSAVGAKLRVAFSGQTATLSAVQRHDYSQDEEFDSDQLGMRIKQYHKTVNHLVCLGSGELADRLVVHLYADADGNISQTQTLTGLDEVSATYDYSAIESEAELIAEGTDKLKSLIASDEVSVDFDADSDVYDVGDIVGAYDNITKMYISTEIKKKIVTIKNGQVTISLTPDTAKSSASQGTSGGSISNVDAFYPVGAIYLSTNSTSPSKLFGGTWEQIKDTFLLACGSTYAAGATGGEAKVKLKESELPKLSGTVNFRAWSTGSPYLGATGIFSANGEIAQTENTFAVSTSSDGLRQLKISFGGDAAHNNMPPYLAVYAWKRTA